MARAKRRPTKAPKPTKLTIAIEGEGLGLKDVGLRQLAQLFEATAAVVEAVAHQQKLEPPRLSLEKAKQGSAAYVLRSEDVQAPRVVRSFLSVARKRGKGSSPQIRSSLSRLHATASKTGSGLRIDPAEDGPTQTPVYLAPPVEEDRTTIDEGTVVFARVVGIRIDARDRGSVTLRYDDGGSGDFDASPEMLDACAKLIARSVKARVTYLRGTQQDFDGEIESVEERSYSATLMQALREAHDVLAAEDVSFDASTWFAAEAEDRDE